MHARWGWLLSCKLLSPSTDVAMQIGERLERL